MQTTPTIEMIPSSGKKVRKRSFMAHGCRSQADNGLPIVCVSDTLIAEIKRIIKSSEIMKYDRLDLKIDGKSKADNGPGKVTRTGQRRTKMADKSLKSAWTTIIFLSKLVFIFGFTINITLTILLDSEDWFFG
jgi:hypothetical protein